MDFHLPGLFWSRIPPISTYQSRPATWASGPQPSARRRSWRAAAPEPRISCHASWKPHLWISHGPINQGLTWPWRKIKQRGGGGAKCRAWSMSPLTRLPFWNSGFSKAQPHGFFGIYLALLGAHVPLRPSLGLVWAPFLATPPKCLESALRFPLPQPQARIVRNFVCFPLQEPESQIQTNHQPKAPTKGYLKMCQNPLTQQVFLRGWEPPRLGRGKTRSFLPIPTALSATCV